MSDHADFGGKCVEGDIPSEVAECIGIIGELEGILPIIITNVVKVATGDVQGAEQRELLGKLVADEVALAQRVGYLLTTMNDHVPTEASPEHYHALFSALGEKVLNFTRTMGAISRALRYLTIEKNMPYDKFSTCADDVPDDGVAN